MVQLNELLLEFVTQAFGGSQQGNPRLSSFPQARLSSGAAKGLSWGFPCGPFTMKDGHLSSVIGYLVGVTLLIADVQFEESNMCLSLECSDYTLF